MRRRTPEILLALVAGMSAVMAPPAEAGAPSDERAVRIAESVLQNMGGRASWDGTRIVRWKFFGGRTHYWDRHTGDIRIESPERERDGERTPARLVLMNVNTKKGRVWEDNRPVTEPEKLKELLQWGDEVWVNDSYWMFMPYKLLDPGVTLKYSGERPLEDGRPADVLDMTFDGVGYTPENRYEIFVARDTGLVEQWAFFAKADDTEPAFTMPWSDWKTFGKIRLATNHGRDLDWQIAVFDELPRSVFTSEAEVGSR